jgi:hypothetical protein
LTQAPAWDVMAIRVLSGSDFEHHTGDAMRTHKQWLTIPLTSVAALLIGIGLAGGRADDSQRLTAEDVIRLWKPTPDGVVDYQQFEAAPKDSVAAATATFRVVGPSFERLWNHYAERCGMVERYEAKRLLISGGNNAKGTYVVNDRASSDAKVERGLSVFLLRTDRYAVTATIQPDPDGKAMRGSIAAIAL